MALLTIDTSITQSPEIMGGQPHIEGRRIRVKDIVFSFEALGMSADEIADTYDLKVADIFSALAFYHINQQTLRDKWKAEQDQAAALKASIPSKINKTGLHGRH